MKELILSPSYKTSKNHCRAAIQGVQKEDPLQPVTLLLPSTGIIHDLRQQVGDTMGVRMYQFYRLGHAILDEAALPICELNDTAIRRLLRLILSDLHAEGLLTTFAPVWERPGFLQVALEWVREMKSQGIFPEEYVAHATKSGNAHDRQLAELYTRYQTFLQQQNYSDADGLLWVAAEVLENDPDLFQSEGPLFVLGFDQFTPVQRRILQQLASRFQNIFLYLVWDAERLEDSLALARLAETREQLLGDLSFATQTLVHTGSLDLTLAHLHRALFEDRPTGPISSAIQLVEAPSRETEVRRVLREVKKLLLAGMSPRRIAVLVPNPGIYRSIVQTIAKEYGLSVECDQPLLGNPAAQALANLLCLAPDFSWQATFEALRTPYIHQSWLTTTQIDLLDKLSRKRPVLAGRDQWQYALQPLQSDARDVEDKYPDQPKLVETTPAEELAALAQGLDAFFDHLAPPEIGTYRDYTWWVQTALLGVFPPLENREDQLEEEVQTLDMWACCKEGPYAQRDIKSLDLVLQAMRRLLASAETIPDGETITWETYRNELLNLLSGYRFPPDLREAHVRFGSLVEGRARTTDYLFVMGLSEGEFPNSPALDVFYAPSEREQHPLPLISVSPADAASLWWQVIGNVGQRLTLTRPYVDDNGAPWQASPYWKAVRACFDDLSPERVEIAPHPIPKEAANQSELLVALVQTNAQVIPATLQTAWEVAKGAELVMRLREENQPSGIFEGVIGAVDLQDDLMTCYGADHVWSASRLNQYANCPYGFFAQYILKLEPGRDPEEGVDAMQRGSLLHAILEDLYQRMTAQNVYAIESNLGTIHNLLESSCEKIFPTAPQRYCFRPGALWRHEQAELQRMLRALVAWECKTNGPTARFVPYLQEAGFGIGSKIPPLLVQAGEVAFRLRGRIDRLDQDAEGNLRVMDYKSGSTKYYQSDLQKGLALQTALYALAAETYWAKSPGRIAESMYVHIASLKRSGKLAFTTPVWDNEKAARALTQASEGVVRVRSGRFPSAPAKPVEGWTACRTGCEYAPLCRVTRQSIRKSDPEGRVA